MRQCGIKNNQRRTTCWCLLEIGNPGLKTVRRWVTKVYTSPIIVGGTTVYCVVFLWYKFYKLGELDISICSQCLWLQNEQNLIKHAKNTHVTVEVFGLVERVVILSQGRRTRDSFSCRVIYLVCRTETAIERLEGALDVTE